MSESFMDQVAKRKLGAPEGWESCGWERVGTDGVIVKGGVPRLLKSGPHRGKKTWRDSVITEAVVTDAEIEAERARFVAETGMCGECHGKAQVFSSWSVADGIKYRPCRACNATGAASADQMQRNPQGGFHG